MITVRLRGLLVSFACDTRTTAEGIATLHMSSYHVSLTLQLTGKRCSTRDLWLTFRFNLEVLRNLKDISVVFMGDFPEYPIVQRQHTSPSSL